MDQYNSCSNPVCIISCNSKKSHAHVNNILPATYTQTCFESFKFCIGNVDIYSASSSPATKTGKNIIAEIWTSKVHSNTTLNTLVSCKTLEKDNYDDIMCMV